MFFERDKKILTIISSEACNLHCSYCEIAASTAQAHCNENLKIRKAMENGEFINTIKQIYQKYGFNYKDIFKMNLWGEEPTLTLDSFCIMFPEICKLFPNLKEVFFSTNGVANIDRILQLVNCINNKIGNRTIRLQIQFSFDGYWATKFNRGIDPSIIENNVKYFITELNKIKLRENVEIAYAFHNVIALNVINHIYEQDDGVFSFWKEIYDFQNQFKELTTNPQVVFNAISEGIMTPYNATKEEGILFAQFFNESHNIIEKYFPDIRTVERGIDIVTDDLISLENHSNDFKQDLEKLVFNIISSRQTFFNNEQDSRHPGCEPQCRELKIRYNGQMVHCHNSIFGLSELDNLENPDKQEREVRAINLQYNYCPNLLTDPIEEIQKWDYRWKNLFSIECIPQMYTILVDFMTILAEIGQIDQSYAIDRKKLLRHAYILLHIYNCWENNLNITGSIYGEDFGKIRLYANGFLDFLENRLSYKYTSKKE